jgi:hypothetical protein
MPECATKKRKLELRLGPNASVAKENCGKIDNAPNSPSFSSFFRPQKGKMPLLPSSCFETKGKIKSEPGQSVGLNGTDMSDLALQEIMASVMR